MDNIPFVSEEIIKLILAEKAVVEGEIAYYTKLYDTLLDSEDKALLEEIILIKKKHGHMFSELYYRFTGERLKDCEEDVSAAAAEPSENFPAEFSKGMLSELNNAEISRSLVYDFLNQSVRDTLNEITTDNQNNSQRFSLLHTKYSR